MARTMRMLPWCVLALSIAASAARASQPIALLRGPYLQMATPDSITIRWRTDAPAPGRVSYGLSPGALDTTVSGSNATEHEIVLTGLSPSTTYYYSIGTPNEVLASGVDYLFATSPPAGQSTPTRIWVIGDSGTANPTSRQGRDAFLSYTAGVATDLWLMLGDNAYSDGTDAQYQSAVFDNYSAILRNTPLWPTIGNHDARTLATETGLPVYYDIFTLPTGGEAGGLASGIEAYYSFDYANIHFVVLDSQLSDRSPTGAMATWLQADLAATLQDWIIAYWHHPPYSKGSHDSDSERRLVEMRENILPLLEAGGVDLVLSGHSHSYERSYLLRGHYGVSPSLDPWMIRNPGDGDLLGDGPYTKPTAGSAPLEGTVYAVSGSASRATPSSLDHPAMVLSLAVAGSMVLDVDGLSLDAVFLENDGSIGDAFLIAKGATPGDSDGDGIADPSDSCPYVSNFGQQDRGGFASPASDGIGDACQCGDVSGDGTVGALDLALLRNHVAGVPPGLSATARARCRISSVGDCDVAGAAVLARALSGMAPSPAQLCSRALPETGYEGLEPYAGDAHIHSALANHWAEMADPAHDPTDAAKSCVHSYRLPGDVYDLCRANGLDWCVISHHSNELENPTGSSWWTDPLNAGGWSNPWPWNELVPTDPSGFPLPGGGRTSSELEYLQAIADDRSEDGSFAAFYGIEFTVGAPNQMSTSCPTPTPGAPLCGGHKVAICPDSSITDRCATFAGEACTSEAEFYDFMRSNGCIGVAAHPCGEIAQDFSPLTPAGGGFDDGIMVGYELAASCEFDGAIYSYNYALSVNGVKLGAMFGSDTHNRPGPPFVGSGCRSQTSEPGSSGRGVCWASSLRRATLIAAIRARRCYWVANSVRPRVLFSIEGRPMGATIPQSSLGTPGSIHVVVDADADPEAVAVAPFTEFDLIHDGAIVLSDQPCESGTRCDFDALVPVADPSGYWYLRITDGATKRVITSPIWIE